MFSRLVLPLAYVSALTGCMTAPPKGAFVEYREGQTPVTKPIKYEATYALTATDQPDAPPLASHQLAKGERIGFCRGADGTLYAVAPGYTMALPAGAYSWEVVPGSGPSDGERKWSATREHGIVAGKVILIAAGVGLLVVLAVGAVLLVGFFSLANYK